MEQQKSVVFSEEGLKVIQDFLDNLRIDLGASVAMLLDDSGQLVTDCGWHGDFDIDTFLALVGNEMSAANAVVHLLHEDAAFDLHYHEGQNYEMYTVRINDQIFLTLILERRIGTSGRVGMVWLTLRRAITELRTMLKNAAVKPGTAEGKEIRGAISDALDEALHLLDGGGFLSKPTTEASRRTAPQPPDVAAELPAPALPTPPAVVAETPAPAPPTSSAVPGDSNRVLTYEEARALGLINMDDANEDIWKDQG